MREFKFRTFMKGEFIYSGSNLEEDNQLDMFFCLALPGVEIEQNTGLHDKNGKEIYEGDVLKDKYGNIGTAHWYGSGFEFINTSGMMESGSEWEIIGNIHETPELMK